MEHQEQDRFAYYGGRIHTTEPSVAPAPPHAPAVAVAAIAATTGAPSVGDTAPAVDAATEDSNGGDSTAAVASETAASEEGVEAVEASEAPGGAETVEASEESIETVVAAEAPQSVEAPVAETVATAVESALEPTPEPLQATPEPPQPTPEPIQPANTFTTIDPSTARPICNIHISSPATISAAVAAAKAAFPSWAATTPIERARILFRAACIIRSRNDELARVETLDSGKPFSETSTVDVATGADVLEYYASLVAAGGLDGEMIRLRPTAFVQTTKEPLGVCAAIGAWNYPLQIVLWKSAPCLAAGNTLVYKPSEFTPLHAQYLAEIYHEAGLPDGVFNVVYGAGDVGAALTAHPDVAKVSFTGQVSTGRKVAGTAAGQLKAVTMELGGKSPLIVLPDASIEHAADGALLANFFSSGQVCTNGTRVFVPRSLKEAFERAVLDRILHVRAGDLFDPATNFGPLSSKAHHDKVAAYIHHGIEVDRATLLCGGSGAAPNGVPDHLREGYWIQPTVFTDVTDSMRIAREEIFGPVMAILTYDTVDEAVARANDTELGLAAGVFGRDISLCHSVVARLHAGITWVNTWGESPAQMAVGGWKQSGLGVENGKRGLEGWVQNRSTLVELQGTVPTVFAKL